MIIMLHIYLTFWQYFLISITDLLWILNFLMMYSAYVFFSRCLTVNVPPCSLSLISGQYWAHLFFKKKILQFKTNVEVDKCTNQSHSLCIHMSYLQIENDNYQIRSNRNKLYQLHFFLFKDTQMKNK